jgi:carbamate kinase
VPSPLPIRIIQRDVINNLIEGEFVVIAVGGGGIPVVENGAGKLTGVEAVIDKDFASALLASEIGAELFLISTAVPQIAINYNKPDQQWLDRMTLAEAKAYMQQGHFAKGSMQPKVQAIINYLEAGGKEALVTDPENIERALAGETGTRIVQ